MAYLRNVSDELGGSLKYDHKQTSLGEMRRVNNQFDEKLPMIYQALYVIVDILKLGTNLASCVPFFFFAGASQVTWRGISKFCGNVNHTCRSLPPT